MTVEWIDMLEFFSVCEYKNKNCTEIKRRRGIGNVKGFDIYSNDDEEIPLCNVYYINIMFMQD